MTNPAKAESWLRDLAGNKPLSALAKRVPIFAKKEEIFKLLADLNVQMKRAVWFVKMTNGYSTAIAESKPRKHRTGDAHMGKNILFNESCCNQTAFTKNFIVQYIFPSCCFVRLDFCV